MATRFSSSDVMKFLAHPVTAQGQVHGNFQGEVCTDLKRRREGVRVKHRVDRNAVKVRHARSVYDKVHSAPGSVLRIEMTMNNEKAFRVYRAKEGEPNGEKQWRPMRRGLADLHRRGELSQHINERYLDALASVDDSVRVREILEPVEKCKQWKGRPVRPNRGEFMIGGICNRDLRKAWFPQPPSDARPREILHKIPGRNLYKVSPAGRTILMMFLIAREASVNQLMKKAA